MPKIIFSLKSNILIFLVNRILNQLIIIFYSIITYYTNY